MSRCLVVLELPIQTRLALNSQKSPVSSFQVLGFKARTSIPSYIPFLGSLTQVLVLGQQTPFKDFKTCIKITMAKRIRASNYSLGGKKE